MLAVRNRLAAYVLDETVFAHGRSMTYRLAKGESLSSVLTGSAPKGQYRSLAGMPVRKMKIPKSGTW